MRVNYDEPNMKVIIHSHGCEVVIYIVAEENQSEIDMLRSAKLQAEFSGVRWMDQLSVVFEAIGSSVH
jgi:hypothetical protein